MESRRASEHIDQVERSHPVAISWHNIQVFSVKSKKFYDCRKANEYSQQIIRDGKIIVDLDVSHSSVALVELVSGSVKPGQFLAIMGARFDSFSLLSGLLTQLIEHLSACFSGAGKTTLLNVLTARNLSQVVVKGEVRINGRIADTRTVTAISAYVQQTDVFMPILTVREHLTFQVIFLGLSSKTTNRTSVSKALLRMNSKTTKEERNYRIEQMMRDVSQ